MSNLFPLYIMTPVDGLAFLAPREEAGHNGSTQTTTCTCTEGRWLALSLVLARVVWQSVQWRQRLLVEFVRVLYGRLMDLAMAMMRRDLLDRCFLVLVVAKLCVVVSWKGGCHNHSNTRLLKRIIGYNKLLCHCWVHKVDFPF